MNFKLDQQELLAFSKEEKVRKQSPSNIALIKYWGKKGNQIPANPSLSFTLSKSFTETEITYTPKKDDGTVSIHFLFEKTENHKFEHKIKIFLEKLIEYFPFLTKLHLKISSSNSFPHSAGIASSASSMSALALCLCEIEKKHYGTLQLEDDFLRKSSFIARLGSGSAARSVFPYAATWGEFVENPVSSDEYASPLTFDLHPVFRNYRDAILIVSNKAKKVSSTAGHGLMHQHPFAKARFEQAKNHLKLLLNVLKNGDVNTFIEIVENEALTLHALMMSSNPGYILMEPGTLQIIEKIRAYRERPGIKLCFTLDAGPNVHLLYSANDSDNVEKFIQKELLTYCENNLWIKDKIKSV
ncbi:MAG: hypothetical protein L3J74_11555 [Bacteroidales bacterium]|nr:hypothetical protein [Bacteroidales bacterium]